MSIDTKAIANGKVDRALALIERAQHLLSEAASELSPITGACKQWDQVRKEYVRVHELWRKVSYQTRRSKIDLDSDSKARLVAKEGA